MFKCSECPRWCKDQNSINSHYASAHSFTCDYCDAEYKRESALWQHIEEVHDSSDSIYECEDCNLSFESYAGMLQHNDAKHKLYCRWCGKKYYDQSALSQHEVNKHYVDCQWCNKVFVSDNALQQHIRSQHFKCAYCTQVFTTTNGRKQHCDAKHTVYCDLCDDGYYTQAALNRHIFKTHFKCSYCPKRAGNGKTRVIPKITTPIPNVFATATTSSTHHNLSNNRGGTSPQNQSFDLRQQQPTTSTATVDPTSSCRTKDNEIELIKSLLKHFSKEGAKQQGVLAQAQAEQTPQSPKKEQIAFAPKVELQQHTFSIEGDEQSVKVVNNNVVEHVPNSNKDVDGGAEDDSSSSKVITQAQGYQQHRDTVRAICCDYCEVEYYTQADLEQHKLDAHLTCHLCDKQFNHPDGRNQHEREVHECSKRDLQLESSESSVQLYNIVHLDDDSSSTSSYLSCDNPFD